MFKLILEMNIGGVIDNQMLEDLFRVLFRNQCGILLNFERVLTNLVKIYKSNEFSDTVLTMNDHVFARDKRTPVPPEEVMFVQTAFLLQKSYLDNQNKTLKNNPNVTFHKNKQIEHKKLLKIEFNTDHNLLVIHKIKSPLGHEENQFQFNIGKMNHYIRKSIDK